MSLIQRRQRREVQVRWFGARVPCTSVSSHFLLFALERSESMKLESVTPVLAVGSDLSPQCVRTPNVFVYLCNFAPAVSSIPHGLQPLLLCGSPRRVRPTFLCRRLLWRWVQVRGCWPQPTRISIRGRRRRRRGCYGIGTHFVS